jgi:hypothetical protein
MSRYHELFDDISDEDMTELFGRTVRRGTQIRRQRLVVRVSLIVLAVCIVAVPVSLLLSRQSDQNARGTTALRTTSAGPFQDVVWKHVEYPGVNFAKVSFPRSDDCQTGLRYGFTADVQQVTYIRPRGGTPIALVLVKCNAGSDSPSSLYAFTVKDGSSHPHLLQTLLAAPTSGTATVWYATSFSVSKNAVVLSLLGVSNSDREGLCCPNVSVAMRWTLAGRHFVSHHEPDANIPVNCLSDHLVATPRSFETVDGHVEGSINLKNTSSSTCSLHAWPQVQMLDSNGQPITTEESVVNPRGYATIVTLVPGSVASFNLEYPDSSGYGDATCPASTKLSVTYDGIGSNEITIPLRIQPYGVNAKGELQCGEVSVSSLYAGSGRSGA